MRRSKAPSMLNKPKRACTDSELETHNSEPEDEQYSWGSKEHSGSEKVFHNQNKRVFNIVWRDVTTKKHKTWKGDGTIEVNVSTMKAIMKDETGKYMGCSSKFNLHDLEPDFQMKIGGKEIEIQNEIKDEDEIHDLRKRQMQNRNWGGEEYVSPEKQAEEEKKPKGGFKFKPVLVLKQPELPKNAEVVFKTQENYLNANWGTTPKPYTQSETNDSWGSNRSQVNLTKTPNLTFDSHIHTKKTSNYHLNKDKHKEFICFVRPSELQQFLFQQVLEYYRSEKPNLSLEMLNSLDFKHVLLQICNHPSFVNHKSTTNQLIRHLIPSLPDWSEMGPFDSGKLEFVQYFLNASAKEKHENCIIVAKHTNTLNMIQGLCDFMHIKCLRLNLNDSEEKNMQTIEEFNSKENKSLQIMLINSVETLKNSPHTLQSDKIIIFEEVCENKKVLETLENCQYFTVYYLITAFTIEEILLLNSSNTEESSGDLLDLMEDMFNISNSNDSVCYLHTKLECKCFENTKESIANAENIDFFRNWQHFANPFDDQILKNLLELCGNISEKREKLKECNYEAHCGGFSLKTVFGGAQRCSTKCGC